MSEHLLYDFYYQYRNKTFHLEDCSFGQRQALRRWSLYFFNIWLSSPSFRPRTSTNRIHAAIKHRYPEEEMVQMNLDPIHTVVWLWQVFGFGRLSTSNKAWRLKNQLGNSINGTVRRMFEADFETFIDTVLAEDNPELLNPEMYLGKDQKTVSEEYDIPPRIVKRIFAMLVATGEYKIAMKRVPHRPSPIRALVKVSK